MMKQLIGRGAEAKIFLIDDKTLRKVREKKNYRIALLDEKLRKGRNRREFKILTKLWEGGVNVPKPYKLCEKEIFFDFEFIEGVCLKEILTKVKLEKAFEQIIKMHNLDIVHADLTTLNMLEKDNKIYLIDFGLSKVSTSIEDKAVDLNLFFNSIKNEHPKFFGYKCDLIEKYLKEVKFGEEIIKRLEKVEHRGRNK